MKRKIDREKIERADRESKLILDAERQAREAKTARLRAQRQASEGQEPAQGENAARDVARPRRNLLRKVTRKIVEVH
ncbi:MAG: hypothetical protein E5V49_12550 [Mesorhizobium sp.]|nr:hypothetical protein EN848_31175 [bacterium M00.F.Ca.ET.205.01.1.1]TGU46634.1 hypothetical protein EN795_31570 [bacterium M00.F.Ca.ET.152.01.1.1]TGV31727.1 hypothetical protein EN829_031245 [Mesorhizobium sp. M00.F.Ca.ET.186.01.1.1]TGZ38902.1 hypothetical protein EN805_31165 [bacterium M00.F.Ca.ET.162.01.1.1]TJW32309.1 MAG: hypothetical protein E5V49_12550 [Mesorhizobium sp.]